MQQITFRQLAQLAPAPIVRKLRVLVLGARKAYWDQQHAIEEAEHKRSSARLANIDKRLVIANNDLALAKLKR